MNIHGDDAWNFRNKWTIQWIVSILGLYVIAYLFSLLLMLQYDYISTGGIYFQRGVFSSQPEAMYIYSVIVNTSCLHYTARVYMLCNFNSFLMAIQNKKNMGQIPSNTDVRRSPDIHSE